MAKKTLFQRYVEGNGLYVTQRSYAHDHTGMTFGALFVESFLGKKGGHLLWRCKCDCGRTVVRSSSNLSQDKSAHCGDREKHSRWRNIQHQQDRLLAYVKKAANGCWTWTGAVNKQGYGSIVLLGKTTRAHRASYEMFVGPIPSGCDILHSCDNPGCVNPNHLRPGDQQDNADDIKERGEPGNRLTKNEVRKVKRALRRGGPHGYQKELAADFGVTPATISDIKHGRTWWWLK